MDTDQREGYILEFISGPYEGETFPIDPGDQVEVGRSSQLDLALQEEMVSRRHARITTGDGGLKIEDVGSTNGTFVNGDEVGHSDLEIGDRILIGTSVMKLAEQSGQTEISAGLESEQGEAMEDGVEDDDSDRPETRPDASADGPAGEPEQTPTGSSASESASEADRDRESRKESLSGLIEEVPLPDLLQLFSSSRKSGILTVEREADVGRVYMREGRVYYASMNEDPDISPHKAFYRMLRWDEGRFALEQPVEAPSFDDEIDESIENLLMEGMKQLDEIRNLGDDVPRTDDVLAVCRPLDRPLRNLSDELIDTLQLVFNYRDVSTVLNKSLASDLETLEDIVELRRNDYIEVRESGDG